MKVLMVVAGPATAASVPTYRPATPEDVPAGSGVTSSASSCGSFDFSGTAGCSWAAPQTHVHGLTVSIGISGGSPRELSTELVMKYLSCISHKEVVLPPLLHRWLSKALRAG